MASIEKDTSLDNKKYFNDKKGKRLYNPNSYTQYITFIWWKKFFEDILRESRAIVS